MGQLSLPLFGWQLELMSSHFSTLSKSWSILHLSITLTIWQAKACLLPCQFARSCLLVTHTILLCSLSQSSRKMLGEKQKIPLNVDEEKKSPRLQELEKAFGQGWIKRSRGSGLSPWAIRACIIWKEIPNNKKGVSQAAFYYPGTSNSNASDEILLSLGWPMP